MGIGFGDLLDLSYKSLLGNPVRSALTMLGVFMGVGAVSATLQVGNISRELLAQQLAAREAPLVSAQVFTRDYRRLTVDDLSFIRKNLKNVQAISAYSWVNWGNLVYEDKTVEIAIGAVLENHLEATGQRVLKGRFFNQSDFEAFRSVAVIDEFLATEIFGKSDPVGKRVYAAGRPYIVIGVIDTKLQERDGEPTGTLWIPMALLRAMTGQRDIGLVQVRPANLDKLDDVEQQLETILEQRHPDPLWMRIWTNADDLLQQKQAVEMTSRSLLAVGAIALLVGGVGIANIAIASVVERTGEIGLRRAIGATQVDVMAQFILEALILSIVGGIAAIVTVHGLTSVAAKTFDLPYKFDTRSTAIALGSALVVGVGAVFLPAVRASKLDPVQALKSD